MIPDSKTTLTEPPPLLSPHTFVIEGSSHEVTIKGPILNYDERVVIENAAIWSAESW